MPHNSSNQTQDPRMEAINRLHNLRLPQQPSSQTTAAAARQMPAAMQQAPPAVASMAQASIPSTARVRTPGGTEFHADAQTGAALPASNEAAQRREGALGRLRAFRSRLLNETLADNPLQKAAAAIFTPVANALEGLTLASVNKRSVLGGEEGRHLTVMELLENVGKGAAIGSVLIPDDAAVDPRDPSKALQLAGTLLGAAGEGFAADFTIVKTLGAIAKTQQGKNIAKSAEAALEFFGQGGDVSALRRIGGGAALGGVSELGLQTAALSEPEDVLTTAAFVSVGGAALGGAVAALSLARRSAVAAPAAARAFVDEFRAPTARPEGAADMALVAAETREFLSRIESPEGRLFDEPPGKPEIAAQQGDLTVMRTESGFSVVRRSGSGVEIEATGLSAAEVAEQTGIVVSDVAPQVRRQAEFDATLRPPPEEVGIGFESAQVARLERAAEAEALASRLDEAGTVGTQPLRVPQLRLQDPDLERMFDVRTSRTILQRLSDSFEAASETFRNSFVYEAAMQRFRSMTGISELTLADDFRLLKVSLDRTPRLAEKQIQAVVGPLRAFKGEEFTRAWQGFERIVVLRDLLETAERGLPIPGGKTAAALRAELASLEALSPREVLEAAEFHRQTVNEIRTELIRRGKLKAGDGYEYYFPHVIVEDLARADARAIGDLDPDAIRFFGGNLTHRGALKEPTRPHTRRRGGSERQIATSYVDVMYRAVRRFHLDNAVDDFLSEVGDNFALSRKALTPEERAALDRTGHLRREDGEYAIFRPRSPTYYRTYAIDDETFDVIRTKLAESLDVDIEDVGLREVLAVGKQKEYILPVPIKDRLEQFYAPDPFRRTAATPFFRANSWWKRNTIWWGLSRFFVFQILGDSVNLLRSNPAAFLQLKDGRLDSAVLRSIREIFHQHGTPMMSVPQLVGTMGGGAMGLTLEEAVASEDSSTLLKVSSALAAAGLGYMIGTRSAAGRIRAFSEIYDEADRFGAVNSGFIFQEEALNRRILGERASLLPAQARPAWQRGLDTISTLLSGKVHGDPFVFARVPAEMIEVIQNERENVLRLASYMQQVERGVDPRIAAKRARESLVDYGKFTDLENKVIRGFWLPFYSFYRHNIPNWVKAAVGRDVGGKATVGLAAVAAIGAGDMIAQLWNEHFFPEVERSLEEHRRKSFHIIVGNPATGELYTDVKGKPIVIGWEMPYEQALEFFGLARPGYLYSQLFGLAGERENIDLVERAKLTAKDAATLSGMRQYFRDLLTPVVKLPLEVASNENFFLDRPIVPERYVGTAEGRSRMLEHVASTVFRQFREVKRTAGDVTGRRFDPLTSAFGLGLPVTRVNLDRDLQGYLHERMDEASLEQRRQRAEWAPKIDDIVYSRGVFSRVSQDEPQRVLEVIKDHADSPLDAEAAWRYYMQRGGKGDIQRHWEALSVEERARFFNTLPEWAKASLVYYMNGGENIMEDAGVGASLPAFVGGN